MTAVSDRLPAIDALRGIALFGILVVNLAAFHSGTGGINPSGSITDALIVWLFTGKFILIFSFMFGWGVHTQAARGTFRDPYLRRLLGLFLIGIVHAAFLFFGDILATYAILGLFMLRPVLRDWPVRKLVRSAAILLGVQALVLLLLTAFVLAVGKDVSLGDYGKGSAQLYMTGGFWEVVPQRLADFATTLVSALLVFGCGLGGHVPARAGGRQDVCRGRHRGGASPGAAHRPPHAACGPRCQRRLRGPVRWGPEQWASATLQVQYAPLHPVAYARLPLRRGPDPDERPSRVASWLCSAPPAACRSRSMSDSRSS